MKSVILKIWLIYYCLHGLHVFGQEFKENNSIVVPNIILDFQPSPTKEDYENILQIWTRKTTDLFKKEIWNDVLIKDKKNNVEKKFKDLPLIEKDMILFITSEAYAQFMSFLSNAWDEELKKFEDKNYKPIPKEKIENEKQNPATKTEILAYKNILFEVRKNFAFEQEKFTEEFFNKNSEIFSEKEKKSTLEIMRNWNEKENLYMKNLSF